MTMTVSLISVYFQLFPEGDDQVGWNRSVGCGNLLWLATGNFSMLFLFARVLNSYGFVAVVVNFVGLIYRRLWAYWNDIVCRMEIELSK